MYDPDELVEAFERLDHGKARMSGIREAIRQADANHDVPFQIYFRYALCNESEFYGDALETLITFPEMLAIIDQHPDAPSTRYNDGCRDSLDCVLWNYKWLLEDCVAYYQIPMEDCESFFEDYKKRCLAYGYNLRPYYNLKYEFYLHMDHPETDKYFQLFEKTPRDENADCNACEQNEIVDYYLKHGKLKKAKLLAKDLESRKLRCGSGWKSWLRLKQNYMLYYLKNNDFEKAAENIALLRKYNNKQTPYDVGSEEMYCYIYLDLPKALRIYKKNWKTWLREREPMKLFNNNADICVLFKKLMESRKKQTIKIAYDNSFPLYRKSDSYEMQELFDFYYKQAVDLAKKFDNRNGTDAFMKTLQIKLE